MLQRNGPFDSSFSATPSASHLESDLPQFIPVSARNTTTVTSSHRPSTSPYDASKDILHQHAAPANLPRPATNNPSASTRPGETSIKYWCTVCEPPRPYKNHDDWMKHEKEHETTYICMFCELGRVTNQGYICALCLTRNPDEIHFERHDIQSYAQFMPQSYSCKRRSDLVRHLSDHHGISGTNESRSIAGKWKHTIKKQAWSCGFCGNFFSSLHDRLKHLRKVHFDRNECIHEFNATKAIRGLLLEPRMAKAWKQKMETLPENQSELVWDNASLKLLRTKLEIGPSDDNEAEALVEAAYAASKPDCSQNNEAIPDNAVWPDASSSLDQYRDLARSASGFESVHESIPVSMNPSDPGFSCGYPLSQPGGGVGYPAQNLSHLHHDPTENHSDNPYEFSANDLQVGNEIPRSRFYFNQNSSGLPFQPLSCFSQARPAAKNLQSPQGIYEQPSVKLMRRQA